MRAPRVLFSLIALTLCITAIANAQAPTGIPPFGDPTPGRWVGESSPTLNTQTTGRLLHNLNNVSCPCPSTCYTTQYTNVVFWDIRNTPHIFGNVNIDTANCLYGASTLVASHRRFQLLPHIHTSRTIIYLDRERRFRHCLQPFYGGFKADRGGFCAY